MRTITLTFAFLNGVSSKRALLRIVDDCSEWVSEDEYMILARWNKEKGKNDVYPRALMEFPFWSPRRLSCHFT